MKGYTRYGPVKSKKKVVEQPVVVTTGKADSLFELTDQEKRWRLGFLGEGYFFDIESDSFFELVRTLWHVYRARKAIFHSKKLP